MPQGVDILLLPQLPYFRHTLAFKKSDFPTLTPESIARAMGDPMSLVKVVENRKKNKQTSLEVEVR